MKERWKIIKFESHIKNMKERIVSLEKDTEKEIKHLTQEIKECEEELGFYKKYGHSKNGFTKLDNY